MHPDQPLWEVAQSAATAAEDDPRQRHRPRLFSVEVEGAAQFVDEAVGGVVHGPANLIRRTVGIVCAGQGGQRGASSPGCYAGADFD